MSVHTREKAPGATTNIATMSTMRAVTAGTLLSRLSVPIAILVLLVIGAIVSPSFFTA